MPRRMLGILILVAALVLIWFAWQQRELSGDIRGVVTDGTRPLAGAAALDAIFPAAGNRMYFPELLNEGLEPHAIREVWMSLTHEPNLWVNVNDTLDIKLAALRQHRSQVKDPDGLEKRIREWLRRTDVDGEFYAEGFRVIRF